MDRKQLKHWKERQRAWVEDARYLRFKASGLEDENLPTGLMFEAADRLMAAKRILDTLILAMSAGDDLWGPGNIVVIPAEEEDS